MNGKGAGYSLSHGMKKEFKNGEELNRESKVKFDSNLPIPEGRNHPFKSMAVGDSVLVDEKARVYAHRYGHSSGKKFTTRKEGDAFRVWRVA